MNTSSLYLFLLLIFYINLYRYGTGSARSDGMFLLCGGRDTSGTVWTMVYSTSGALNYKLMNLQIFPYDWAL